MSKYSNAYELYELIEKDVTGNGCKPNGLSVEGIIFFGRKYKDIFDINKENKYHSDWGSFLIECSTIKYKEELKKIKISELKKIFSDEDTAKKYCEENYIGGELMTFLFIYYRKNPSECNRFQDEYYRLFISSLDCL